MRGSNSFASLNVTGTTKETISLMGSRPLSLPHVFHVPWRRAAPGMGNSVDKYSRIVRSSLVSLLVPQDELDAVGQPVLSSDNPKKRPTLNTIKKTK